MCTCTDVYTSTLFSCIRTEIRQLGKCTSHRGWTHPWRRAAWSKLVVASVIFLPPMVSWVVVRHHRYVGWINGSRQPWGSWQAWLNTSLPRPLIFVTWNGAYWCTMADTHIAVTHLSNFHHIKALNLAAEIWTSLKAGNTTNHFLLHFPPLHFGPAFFSLAFSASPRWHHLPYMTHIATLWVKHSY